MMEEKEHVYISLWKKYQRQESQKIGRKETNFILTVSQWQSSYIMKTLTEGEKIYAVCKRFSVGWRDRSQPV